MGLPPYGCTAFGDEYRASATGAWESCVLCPSASDPDYTLRTVGPLVGALLAICTGVAAYVWAVQRFPDFKGWIATSSIILTYLQVSSQLAGDLRDVGGPLVQVVKSIFSFASFELSTGRPECLFPKEALVVLGSDTVPVVMINGIILAFLLIVLMLLFGASRICGCLRRPEASRKSDRFADRAVIVYSLQLPPALHSGARALGMGIAAFTRGFTDAGNDGGLLLYSYSNAMIAVMVVFGGLLAAELLIGLLLMSTVRQLVLKRRRFKVVRVALRRKLLLIVAARRLERMASERRISRDADAPQPGSPATAVSDASPAAPQRQSGGRCACLRARRKVSSHRQAERVRFLTAKYGDHAPYWQFVKWVRSALFIVARALPQALVDPTNVWRPLTQALGSVVVLILFGLLHAYWQPYSKAYQNRLELVLIASSACATALSCAYPFLQEDEAARLAIDVFLLMMMLGPLVVLFTWWGIPWARRRWSKCRAPDVSTRGKELTDIQTSTMCDSSTPVN